MNSVDQRLSDLEGDMGRLQDLEEEVEAGLSSLGEQVDRHDRMLRKLLGRPETPGFHAKMEAAALAAGGLRPTAGLSSRDQLLEGARHHMNQAEACLENVDWPDHAGQNRNWIQAMNVHIETALTMIELTEVTDG